MSKHTLTSQQRRAWLTLTGMLTKLPTALDAEMANEADLTFFEYMVLSTLAEEPDGVLKMSILAERTNGSLSRLSHVVRRLENQGLVERHGSPQDRRVTNAVLTPAGRQRVEAAAPGHVRYVRDLVIDGTSEDDLEVFERVSAGILERLTSAV